MLTQPVAFIASVALGVTFLISGVSKLRDPGAFLLGVLDYRVLPPRLARLYGRILPFAELVCGLALVAGLWSLIASIFAAALLVSFLLAVTINLARGRRLDCHCFGSRQSEPLGWTTVVRLCVLLACAVLVIGWRGRTLLARPPVDWLPALLLALGALLGLYLLGDAPAVWRIWRTVAVRGSTRRVSLRSLPLQRQPSTSAPIPVEDVQTVQRR